MGVQRQPDEASAGDEGSADGFPVAVLAARERDDLPHPQPEGGPYALRREGDRSVRADGVLMHARPASVGLAAMAMQTVGMYAALLRNNAPKAMVNSEALVSDDAGT